jgi:uncharacterized protein with PIN domain
MLGKLCKLLRICGIDAAYSNQGMAILLEARKQNRIVLTRNTRLQKKKEVFFMKTSDPVEQLEHIISEFKLKNRIAPFSRCIECNCKLKAVDKTLIRNSIPYFTYKHFDEFALCPNCRRVFWKGSHYKRMLKDIRHLLRRT